jgi:hypothetical protein
MWGLAWRVGVSFTIEMIESVRENLLKIPVNGLVRMVRIIKEHIGPAILDCDK